MKIVDELSFRHIDPREGPVTAVSLGSACQT